MEQGFDGGDGVTGEITERSEGCKLKKRIVGMEEDEAWMCVRERER